MAKDILHIASTFAIDTNSFFWHDDGGRNQPMNGEWMDVGHASTSSSWSR